MYFVSEIIMALFSNNKLADKEIKTKLAEQSLQAIQHLIKSADTQRKIDKNISFHDHFFQEAKKHII